jgi:hypothetical protein
MLRRHTDPHANGESPRKVFIMIHARSAISANRYLATNFSTRQLAKSAT